MNVINLPPFAPTLIESTRAIGYSLESAVADIIDNSIAAGACNINIEFFPIDEEFLSILDDGAGMSSVELTTAMQYGSKNPLDDRDSQDLGRFGLGLKTASLSQCRMLTVASIKDGTLSVRRWDIDYVRSSGNWSLLDVTEKAEQDKIPNIEKLLQLQSGTLVVWQKLDRLKAGEIDFTSSMGRKIDNVREHLELVFHRYLKGEPGLDRINISINGDYIQGKDPFLVKKSNRPMDDEVLIIQGSKIVVRPYILPHISLLSQDEISELGGKEGLRKLQGFYVYRNKRLLVWGTWFRMQRKGELSKLARIQVDIPNTLDDLWTLDIKKSSAIPPAEVRSNLQNIIQRIALQSKKKYTVRGKREINDKTIHIWNRMKARDGGYYYEINRKYPAIEQLIKHNPDIEKALNSIFKQIETSLPLNQLYVDLNNDEYLANDNEISDAEIRNALTNMLPKKATVKEQLGFIDQMSEIEPFVSHQKIVAKIRKEILNNG
jgi:hypothetical protein